MASILSLVIISVSYHAYHTNVKWKKRRDEEINAEIVRNKRQSIQMQEGYKLVKVKYTLKYLLSLLTYLITRLLCIFT